MGGYFHPPLSSLCSTVFFIFVHKRSERRRRTRRIKKLLLLYRRASSSAIFISTSRVAQLICLYPCRNSASVFSPKTNQNPTISFYWPTESLFCLSVCLLVIVPTTSQATSPLSISEAQQQQFHPRKSRHPHYFTWRLCWDKSVCCVNTFIIPNIPK